MYHAIKRLLNRRRRSRNLARELAERSYAAMGCAPGRNFILIQSSQWANDNRRELYRRKVWR